MLKKREIFALSIFAIFYILFGLLITLKQESLVYQPSQDDFSQCSALKGVEQVNFKTARLYLNPPSLPSYPTLVIYHGNAGSACDRAFYGTIATQAGYGYALVEYRGYGNDTVQPSHAGVKQTVEDTVTYLQEKNIRNVVVLGESIGTGAASYHAKLDAPSGLILISPFTDLQGIAANRFWFYPTKILVDNAFANVSFLERYQHPLLIIHGTRDTVIPFKLGRELFDSVETTKTFTKITGGGHNDLFTFTETYTAINTFLNSLKPTNN